MAISISVSCFVRLCIDLASDQFSFVTGIGQARWGLGTLPPPSAISSVSVSSISVSPTVQAGGQTLSGPGSTTLAEASQLPHGMFPVGGSHQAPASVAATGTCLSPGSEPFPARLVNKVQSGAFVEMKELLGDNIALLSELDNFHGSHHFACVPGSAKPRLREVSSLGSWLYCFMAYLALRCPDAETRERLVYARLIVMESLRHSGQGWLMYDRIFRQQAALDSGLRWNELHPAILASTLLTSSTSPVQGRAGRSGTFCSVCRGVDHRADQCALGYLHRPDSNNRGKWRDSVASHSLCISWNRGSCRFPSSCTFRHVCSECYQSHPAVQCPSKGNRGPIQGQQRVGAGNR